MKRPEIHISDHAVLRYLERVDGVDVDAIRTKMKRRVAVALDHEGPCGVIVGGYTYKLRGLTVTTVAPSNQPNIRTNRKRAR